MFQRDVVGGVFVGSPLPENQIVTSPEEASNHSHKLAHYNGSVVKIPRPNSMAIPGEYLTFIVMSSNSNWRAMGPLYPPNLDHYRLADSHPVFCSSTLQHGGCSHHNGQAREVGRSATVMGLLVNSIEAIPSHEPEREQAHDGIWMSRMVS